VKRRRLEASKSDDKASKTNDKTSMSVINDGDLQKVDEVDETDPTVVLSDSAQNAENGEKMTDRENVDNWSQSSDDDFLTQTPIKCRRYKTFFCFKNKLV
jgi:hypothetical protein